MQLSCMFYFINKKIQSLNCQADTIDLKDNDFVLFLNTARVSNSPDPVELRHSHFYGIIGKSSLLVVLQNR